MSARKIALLLLILGFGGAVETAWSVRNHVDVGPFGCRVLGGRFYGVSHDFEEESQYAVAAGAKVEITNAFGAVRVHAGAPGEVRVKLKKVVYLDPEEKARAFAAKIAMKADNAGARLQLGTNRDEDFRRDDVGFETHFDVTAPAGSPVLVRNEHGPVDLRDVGAADVDSAFDTLRLERAAGAVTLRSRHGDVVVSHVEGDLDLTSRHGNVELADVVGRAVADVQHGDVTASRLGALKLASAHGSVSVDTVKGDAEVKNEHGPVSARDVLGKATLATTFDHVEVERVGGDASLRTEHGAVKATDVKGALSAEASFDRVSLERIGGPVDVKVEHGGLDARRLDRGARVRASNDEVSIDGFRGPVEVEGQHASVRLSPRDTIADAISVATTHGEIALSVPGGSRFDLEAHTRQGEIHADLPDFAVTATDKDALVGKVAGGGSVVKLVCEHGDVRLESHAAAAKAE
jgi:DUF4097 and DUF4098 domain-containing protein YvlB